MKIETLLKQAKAEIEWLDQCLQRRDGKTGPIPPRQTSLEIDAKLADLAKRKGK